MSVFYKGCGIAPLYWGVMDISSSIRCTGKGRTRLGARPSVGVISTYGISLAFEVQSSVQSISFSICFTFILAFARTRERTNFLAPFFCPGHAAVTIGEVIADLCCHMGVAERVDLCGAMHRLVEKACLADPYLAFLIRLARISVLVCVMAVSSVDGLFVLTLVLHIGLFQRQI